MGIRFSSGDFPHRIYSDILSTALFSEKLLSSQQGLPQSSYFFMVTISTQLLLFWTSNLFRLLISWYFFRIITSSQQLFCQNSYFPEQTFCWAATSWEQVVLQGSLLFAKQPLFWWRNLFRIKIPKEELVFRSIYFRAASDFPEQLLFQQMCFFKRGSFSDQLLFGKS